MEKNDSARYALRKVLFFAMVCAMVPTLLATHQVKDTPPAILVISMDYDGCLKYNVRDEEGNIDMAFYDVVTKETSDGFNLRNDKTNKTNWQKVIRERQDDLYAYIVALCKRKKYKEVIITCGSLRQNVRIDVLNMYKKLDDTCTSYHYTGSCMQGLGIFKEKVVATLREKYGEKAPNVTLDRFLMDDVFNLKSDGTTFQQILDWLEEEDSTEFSNQKQTPWQGHFLTDTSKISLHYTFMHRIAGQHRDAEIDYYVFDDAYDYGYGKSDEEASRNYVMNSRRPKLLNACNWTFATYRALVPFNVRYVSVPLYGGVLGTEAHITTVCGLSIEERGIENQVLTEEQRAIIKQSKKLGMDKNYRRTAYKMMFLAAGSKGAMQKKRGAYCFALFQNRTFTDLLLLKMGVGSVFFFIACSFIFYCVSKLFVQLGILSSSTRIDFR